MDPAPALAVSPRLNGDQGDRALSALIEPPFSAPASVAPAPGKTETTSRCSQELAGDGNGDTVGSGQAPFGPSLGGQLRLADGSRKYVYARNLDQVIRRLQDQRWHCGRHSPCA